MKIEIFFLIKTGCDVVFAYHQTTYKHYQKRKKGRKKPKVLDDV